MAQLDFNRELDGYLSKRRSFGRSVFRTNVFRSRERRETTVRDQFPDLQEDKVHVIKKEKSIGSYVMDALAKLKLAREVPATETLSPEEQEKLKGMLGDEYKESIDQRQKSNIEVSEKSSEFDKEEKDISQSQTSMFSKYFAFLFGKKEPTQQQAEEQPVRNFEEEPSIDVVPAEPVEKRSLLHRIASLFVTIEPKQSAEVEQKQVSHREEANDIIKELIKVNVSALKKLSTRQYNAFKNGEDFHRFKDAIDRYKVLANIRTDVKTNTEEPDTQEESTVLDSSAKDNAPVLKKPEEHDLSDLPKVVTEEKADNIPDNGRVNKSDSYN